MATFELYRRSTIGMCLTETLDQMVSNGILSPELAIQVLIQFDKVICFMIKEKKFILYNWLKMSFSIACSCTGLEVNSNTPFESLRKSIILSF